MRSLYSVYSERVFPWLNDKLTNDPELIRLRRETLAQARGRVVEIGFGTGANVAHYPSAVRSVIGIEPSTGMLARSRLRLATAHVPVRTVVATAEALPFADRSFDTAVSTLTLCSVADPGRALSELRRVLRDAGRLLVMEHGLAPDENVVRWQRRLDPMQHFIACGCHLTRPMPDLIKDQRFTVDRIKSFHLQGLPRTHGWMTAGTALKDSHAG